jgi:poly-gamma-glutamate synthesis protein (capsule biosynthesis protein)
VEVLAHGAIDAGADVYFNNGGSHMGIEIYRGKAICYGVPNFFLQTEAVHQVPDAAKARFGLTATATAADFLDVRAACAKAAFAEGGPLGTMLAGAGGSAVYLCDFDDAARLRGIRIQPIEPLGGTIFGSTDGPTVPRFRRQLPMVPDPGSEVSHRVLDHVSRASEPFGTMIEIHDGVGVVRFD